MADKESEIPESMKNALRDYWLQYYRQKKFEVPEELEQASGKTLDEGISFKVRFSFLNKCFNPFNSISAVPTISIFISFSF